jgi:hypothetical protein
MNIEGLIDRPLWGNDSGQGLGVSFGRSTEVEL